MMGEKVIFSLQRALIYRRRDESWKGYVMDLHKMVSSFSLGLGVVVTTVRGRLPFTDFSEAYDFLCFLYFSSFVTEIHLKPEGESK